ncbi:hypothetical protein MITS9509_01808 [Synechococcus sp. MIT S9509]|nr:hypothetical protein MITS9509_01808 [Synechococcus sp. MIT S9509]
MDQPNHLFYEKGFLKGKVSDELMNGPMRGWICGHFYDLTDSRHRNDIEICIKVIKPGFAEKTHYHLCSFEFIYIISGCIEYIINGECIKLMSDEYYFLRPCTHENILNVITETKILCVRTPSIPNNKIFS